MNKNLKAQFLKITVFQDCIEGNVEECSRVFYTLAGESTDEFLYMFGINSNNICRIKQSTGDMDIWYGDEKYPCCKKFLFIRSIAYENYIYFISGKTNYVLKYNTTLDEKKYIYLEGAATEFVPYLYGKQLFLLPVGYSEWFVCIDVESDRVRYLSTNYKVHLSPSVLTKQYIFVHGIVTGGCIYRGSYLDSSIQKYNIRSEKFQYITIEDFNRPIRQVIFDGKYFWLLSNNDGMLVRWNPKDGRINYSIDLAKETEKKGMLYAACIYVNELVYIIERMDSCILELNIKENLLCVYDCKKIPGFEMRMPNRQAFSEAIRVDNEGRLIFFPFNANGVVILNSKKEVEFYMTRSSKLLGIAGEQQEQTESICTLEALLDRVQHCYSSNTRQTSDIGEQIFQNIY